MHEIQSDDSAAAAAAADVDGDDVAAPEDDQAMNAATNWRDDVALKLEP